MDEQHDGRGKKEALDALARTLAPGATALTYRPAEVRVRPQVEAPLPGASIAVSAGASPEETAVFVERMARAQGPTGSDGGGTEAYEIVAPIGRGGMGEVWRAVQRSLGREIALKQLTADNPVAEEHFLSEARVTARLSHANIVPVHALGRSGDGRPMLAMKLVKGRSWLDVLREEPGQEHMGQHLQVFLAVCNAVAFAHAEGFLHRDLKPANVMVGQFGQVFVVDWGLAVGLDRETCERSGILFVRDVQSPAGTPAYMAPELALGDGESQGPHTDVYLLGACLHEIVTGTPPHAVGDTMEALRHAADSPPPEYDASVPPELREICRRALAQVPAERFPDVTSLRAAVETFLAHDAARAITEKGLRALALLKERIGARAPAGERDAAAQTEQERAIHRAYTEARFAFEHSLESWPEGEEAKQGIVEAARVMLRHAIATEDLPLAALLAGDVDDAALGREVAALRARLAAREQELAALREQAVLLDDRRVSRPLSNVFFLAAALGAAASIPTRMLLDARGARGGLPVSMIWTVVTAISGAYALFMLRGAKRSLVSPRVGWTWASVGAACLAAGVISTAQGEKPFENAGYTMMMIAIGFVAQAMQTRLSLLFPAVIMFLSAIAMAFFPSVRVEIFGVCWLVSLAGVGVVLRRRGGEAAPASVVDPRSRAGR